MPLCPSPHSLSLCPHQPPLMYAELGFADSKMQTPLNLTESGAVLYSEVGGNVPHPSHDPSTPTRPPKSSSKPSTKPHPPEPYSSSKPAHSREVEKHPLGRYMCPQSVLQRWLSGSLHFCTVCVWVANVLYYMYIGKFSQVYAHEHVHNNSLHD